MKLFKCIIILMMSIGICLSCNKVKLEKTPIASMTITNVVANGKAVRMGSLLASIANNSFGQLSMFAGENDLYIWPVGDSSNPYFIQSKLFIDEWSAYSLFLGGTATAVDAILIKENIPYRTDSSAGIRFINLAFNSPPLSITLSTSPTVNKVSNLAYKQITDFESYPAFSSSSYSFQIRNAITNSLLFTYTFGSSNPFPRFSNVSLVIRGMVGSGPGIGVTRVNHDR